MTLELNNEPYQKLYLTLRLNNTPAGRPLVMNKDRVIIEIVGKKTRLQRFILTYMFIEYSWLAVTRLG